MKTNCYVLLILHDVEPVLHGPFAGTTARDRRAKTLKAEYGDEHGIFPLDISSESIPKISAYSSAFFEKEEA